MAAGASGPALTYHGRLFKSDGALVSGSVNFKLQIRSPLPQDCLLWEETQTQALNAGVFVLVLNGADSQRTDLGSQSFEDVFSNSRPFTVGAANCASGGGTYTPSSDDARVLKVSFNDGSFGGWEEAPAQALNYVPKAIDAMRVAGIPAGSLLRFVESDGTLVNTSPLNNAQYLDLISLIDGTSTKYARNSAAKGSVVTTVGGSGNVSSPVAGSVWLDTVTNNLKFYDGTVVKTLGTSGGYVTSVATGTGLTGGPITSSGTISIAAGGVGSAELAANSVNSSKIVDGSVASSDLDPAINITTSGAIVSGVNTTRDFKLYPAGVGTNKISFASPAALSSDYSLTWPLTAGAASQVLTTDGAGHLTWTTPAGTGISALTGDVTASGSGSVAATVASVGGSTAATIHTAETLANAATNANTASTLVKRDASGNFAAGVVTANGLSLNNAGSVLNVVNPVGGAWTMTLPSTAGSSGQALTTNGSGTTTWTSVLTPSTGFVNGGNAFGATSSLGNSDNFDLNVKTNNVTRLTVQAGGNVGIGTTNPQAALHVNGNIRAERSTGSIGFYATGSGDRSTISSNNNNDLIFNPISFPAAMVVHNSSGNVGIGTTAPTSRLHVATAPLGTSAFGLVSLGSGAFDGNTSGYFVGSANGTILAANAATGYAGNLVDLQVAGVSKFKIDSSGNVTNAGTSTLNGNTTTSGNFAQTGSATFSTGTGAVSLNGPTTIAANQNFSLASGTGTFSQTYTGTSTASSLTANSVTSSPAQSITANGLTSGSILNLSSNSTAATSGNTGLNIAVSGANGASGVTRYGLQSAVTATGTNSTNVAGYFSATGGTNNYGLIVANGNVGIGTTAPSSALQVAGVLTVGTGGTIQPTLARNSVSGGLAISANGGIAGSVLNVDYNGGSNLFNVQSSGYVGIGTTNPTQALDIRASGVHGLQITNSTQFGGLAVSNGTNTVAELEGYGAGNDNGALDLQYAGAKGVLLLASGNSYLNGGNVGIGTTAPGSLLDVAGQIRAYNSNGSVSLIGGTYPSMTAYNSAGTSTTQWITIPSSGGMILDYSGSAGGGTGTFAIRNQMNGPNHVFDISASGNVGIGTTAPGQKLSVAGTIESTTGGLKFPDGTTQTTAASDAGTWAKSGTNVYYNGGNVGIGTTAPATALDVNGNITTHFGKFIGMQDNSTPVWQMSRSDGTQTSTINYDGWGGWLYSGKIGIGTTSSLSSSTAALYVNGNVGIGTTAPTAKLNLAAGTAAASSAPLKFTSGVLMTAPEDGAMEYASSSLYYTIGSTRYVIPLNTASGNYSNVATIGNTTGSITMSPLAGNSVIVNSATVSTSSTTGALIVSGGAGISGAVNASGNIASGGSISATISAYTPQIYGSTAASGTIKIDGTDNLTKGNVLLASAGGNVGIGTTTPGYNLDVTGTMRASSYVIGSTAQFVNGYAQYGNVGNKMSFPGTDSIGFTTNYNERMRIDSSGNVGIGTTSPGFTLDVRGNAYFGSTINLGSSASMSSSTGANLNLYSNNSTNLGVSIQSGTGNVGIGTTTPAAKLDISGGIIRALDNGGTWPSSGVGLEMTYVSTLASGAGSASIQSYDRGGAAKKELRILASPIKLYSSATDSGDVRIPDFMISTGGNVGIGTTAPAAKLHVQGQIVSGQTIVASGATADFSTGNVQILQSVGGSAITLSNMVDGGSYMVIVADTTSRTYTFSGCTSARFLPANGPTVASYQSIYSIIKTTQSGVATCYISWQTGY